MNKMYQLQSVSIFFIDQIMTMLYLCNRNNKNIHLYRILPEYMIKNAHHSEKDTTKEMFK